MTRWTGCSRSTQLMLDRFVRSHFHAMILLQMGVSSLCQAVEGNFLKMPFAEACFDGAYAIEATCHADKVSTCIQAHLAAITKSLLLCSHLWSHQPCSLCSCKTLMLKFTACSNLDLTLPATSGYPPRSMTPRTGIMFASWMRSTMATVCRYAASTSQSANPHA